LRLNAVFMRDEDAYPIGTVVIWLKTGERAIIRKKGFQKDERGFLHYLGEFEDRPGLFALYHDEVMLDCLPLD
jgi:hypothetical protein